MSSTDAIRHELEALAEHIGVQLDDQVEDEPIGADTVDLVRQLIGLVDRYFGEVDWQEIMSDLNTRRTLTR